MKVGVISDTHGLMRPQALDALRGTELILHAGDIGSPEILDWLGTLAPVNAIRGNNDTDRWAKKLPEILDLELEDVRIHMLHNLKEISPRQAATANVVIAGHSHRPIAEHRDGVLYLNPGSAGPRRFKLPISVATLTISGANARARIIELDI
jgi:putative phosphoesterase